MRRDEALEILRRHQPELKRLGVERLYLIGSTARDEAGEDSDVELFYDSVPGSSPLLLFDVMEETTRVLGRETDVVRRASLHRLIRPRVERACVMVF